MIRLKFNLGDFRKYVFDKRCICFGAGLQGLHIIYLFENWNLVNNIVAFADNNPQKWNTFYEVENYIYPVMKMNEVLGYIDENTVIIITCSDVVGVVKQLEKYEELKNIVCFSLAEIAQMQLLVSNYSRIIHEEKTALIPKKIHYCWFGDKMPNRMKENIEKWHELCPDYEFIEWNESNYDVNRVKYVAEAYRGRKWGFVPDYIRLDIVCKYGGIYLDTDVEILQKPDELLYQSAFAISDGSFFVNLGAGFGAKPNHPIIREMRDYYENMCFIKSDGSFDLTPCQIQQYKVLRKYDIQLMDISQNTGGINIYPMIMAATNTYSMQMRLCDQAFFAHYGASSWMSEKHKEYRRGIQEEETMGLINYNIG